MKKAYSLVSVILVFIMIMLCGCTPFDKNYGVSENNTSSSVKYENIPIPDIKSDDEQMPTFFDISLFDEENYSEIYLGKNFEYKITYAGSELEVPSSLKKMENLGWKMLEGDNYNSETLIMAGKSLRVNFENEYGKQIVAQFYNKKNSSVELQKCDIVRFIVPENVYEKNESVYGQFFVNGVSNESAITDVIQCLGAPSHFYPVTQDDYYLDYFISSKDKRSCITVYINIPSDSVTAIEFSNYK